MKQHILIFLGLALLCLQSATGAGCKLSLARTVLDR